jgi:glycosyltransferase involved in cell wall biosynthesis
MKPNEPTKTDKPTVSIITRTKNRPLFLKRAIESVLGQSYENWEHIVVNDGGNVEHLRDLANHYETNFMGRLRLIENSRQPGRWGAANSGLLAASGRFFVLLDDDDTWMPTFLEVAVGKLLALADANVRAVATQSEAVFEEIADNNIRTLHREPYNPQLRDVTLFRMAGGAGRYLQPNAILFSTSLREEVGLFDENLPVIGDWDYNIRVLQKFDFHVIPEIHSRYHHRVGTSGINGNSIFADADKHQLHYTKKLNESLRKDLQSGEFGLGILMNVSRAISEQAHEPKEIKSSLKRIAEAICSGNAREEAAHDGFFARLLRFFSVFVIVCIMPGTLS